MTDSDPPPSSSPRSDPVAQVIPFTARPRVAPEAPLAERALIVQLTRAALGSAAPANEGSVAPDPGWSELRASLEGQDLDREIAGAEGDLARGDEDAARRLRALRSLRAMRSFERGDRDAAYQEWEALARESPADAGPLLTRATFFHDDFEVVVGDLSRAAARAPDDPEVYRRRGRCFVRRGDWERALPDFRRLVHLRPRDLEALDFLANALRFTGDHEAAIRIVSRAIKLAPWRAEFYKIRAACFMAKGAHAEELLDLDRWIERDPNNAEAFRSRAYLHSRMNDEERNLADLSRAIALDPTDAGTFQRRAYIHARRGQLDRAIADLSRAVEIKPDSDVFRTSRAELYLDTGALDLAIADCDRVIEAGRADERRAYLRSRRRDPLFLDWDEDEVARDPDREREAEAYWLRAHAHRRRGDRERALADYQQARSLDRRLFRQLVESEDTNRELGRTTAQLDDLDALILLAPEDPTWLMHRAEILKETEQYETALADLDRVIALDRWPDEAYHLRATVHLYLSNLAQAIADESSAIAIRPSVGKYHAWRGLYRLYEEGASAEAEADVRRAVELSPLRFEESQLLAMYLEECERWEEAVAVWDRVIAIEPRLRSGYAGRALARLHVGRDEATLRAALADLDAALAHDEDDEALAEKRAEVLALLGEGRGR
jgi:tetratricopeptide (TPR) repeat protein